MDDEINEHIEALQGSRGPDDPPLLDNVPLKIPPKHGIFSWWPVDEDWIHPDDVQTANRLIPSNRLFRREEYDDEYYLLTYGNDFIRAKPVIWLEVETDGYELGDQVEIKSQFGKLQPAIAVITEIRWDKKTARLLYTLVGIETRLSRRFTSDEFQLAHQIGTHLNQRKLRLMQQSRLK